MDVRMILPNRENKEMEGAISYGIFGTMGLTDKGTCALLILKCRIHSVQQITEELRTKALKVYRTKRPMTKCLARFMDEIEHYDPTIIYRPGKLQVVPDALSVRNGTPAEIPRS